MDFQSSTRVLPVKTVHKDTYPLISPTRPELSQAGKTVLVTGGGTGVGFAIASSFARAGASTLVLAARREAVLQEAAKKLKDTHPGLKVLVRTVDTTDPASVTALWAWLAEQGVVVDVLILNAGLSSPPVSMLDAGFETVANFYKVNVFGHMAFAEAFHKQDKRGSTSQSTILNVATGAAWDLNLAAPVPVYSLTKNSGIMLMQQIASHVPVETTRIVNFHPGLIASDPALTFFKTYVPGGDPPWDTAELAGDFAVWLASPEADFLHGRYVESGWDLDELRKGEPKERLEKDPWYLKVGILGLHP